jgi:putative ABC transport system permease protein
MRTLLQDLRFALRQIAKHPGFALSTVLTLALGIGANTAIFSIIHAVLLRPLPYAHGGRLVHIGYRDPGPDVSNVFFSVQELQDYRRQTRALASVEEYHSMTFTLLGGGDPDRVKTGVVSADFFKNFGVKPVLGRSFLPGEDRLGAAPVLLLTYPYWQRRFAGDPGIVGKSVVLDGKSATVVGVLPRIPQFPEENDVYVPASACSIRTSEYMLNTRKARMLSLFGQLKPGATVEQARADARTLIGRWRQSDPDSYPEERYRDVPTVPVQEELTGKFRPTLLILFATVGLVLLIACVNVANLTLARLIRREREVAVRSALGAGRGRLLRQLLTESTVLALLGGALGVVLAYAGLNVLVAFANRFTPRAVEIEIDSTVLFFSLLVALATGLAFGMFPALQASVRDLASPLKAGGGRSTVDAVKRRFRFVMTVAQVAVSFVLLIMAALAARSLFNLRKVDTGFQTKNVVAMTLAPGSSRSKEDAAAFYQAVAARLESLAGVEAVGMAGEIPLQDDGFNPVFEIEGRKNPTEGEGPRANFDIASSGFFKALNIPLREGRLFTLADRVDAPEVLIINEAFARKYWPNQSPVGQRIALKFRGGGDWLTIVGVVGNVKQVGLGVETGPAFYLAFDQLVPVETRLFIRTAQDPLEVVPAISKAVHAIDPQVPVTAVRTLEQVRGEALAPARLTAILLTLFGLLACTIAVLGISGVVASSVSERTHEIGIRAALGADRGKTLSNLLWQGMAPVLIGLGLGAVAALWLTRFLSSILFDVAATDPLTYLGVATLLLLASVLACMVPARHAMSIEPVIALRYG